MAGKVDDNFCVMSGISKQFEWDIDNIFAINEDAKYLNSNEFTLFGAKWCLRIYPSHCGWCANNIEEDEEDCNVGCANESKWISLYLMKTSGLLTCRLIYSLKIKNDNLVESKIFDKSVSDDQFKEGTKYFILRNRLRDHMEKTKDRLVTVGCTFYLEECVGCQWLQEEELPRKGVELLLKDLEHLFRTGHQSDVIIKVKDTEFQAHRLILSARCPVFASMFQHSMSEKNTGVIEITDCDANTFKEFLLYLYSGKLKVSPRNALDLYSTCDKYNVIDLKDKCSSIIARHMSVDIVLDAFQLSVLHNDSELRETATKYFIENFKTIFHTEKWVNFMMENALLAGDILMKMADEV